MKVQISSASVAIETTDTGGDGWLVAWDPRSGTVDIDAVDTDVQAGGDNLPAVFRPAGAVRFALVVIGVAVFGALARGTSARRSRPETRARAGASRP